MRRGQLRCDPLPLWLTRLAPCSFPLKGRYVSFNGQSSVQQAYKPYPSLLTACSCRSSFSSLFNLIPMLTLAHSFTRSDSRSRTPSIAFNSQLFFGITRRGSCGCLGSARLCRAFAWAQWKPRSRMKIVKIIVILQITRDCTLCSYSEMGG